MKTRPRAAELARAAAAALSCGVLLGAAPPPASSAPPEDCLARVSRGLSGKDVDAEPCLADGAVWTDADGAVRGRDAARARLKSLADQLRWDGAGPRTIARDGLTLLAGGYVPRGRGVRRWRILALEGPAPWAAITVYTAARDWPAPAAGPVGTAAGSDMLADAFNDEFSNGDVDGFLSHWRPDALFVSFVFPTGGSGLRFFFQHQARRYVKPRLIVERRWEAAGDEHLLQGHIRGRCRESGRGFDLPLLLLVRLQERRVRLAYEAFSVEGDGCGPFLFQGDAAAVE